MKKYITLIFMGLLSFSFMGCNTVKDYIDNESIIVKSAIQYGALEYIDNDSENYDRVIKYTEELKQYVSGDTTDTLNVLFARIKQDIINSDLKQQEKIIALTIVDVTKEYATAKLEEQGISLDEYNTTVLTLIGWVQEAAELSQMGVTAGQMG